MKIFWILKYYIIIVQRVTIYLQERVLEYNRHLLVGNPTRAISKIRHFVERHLPSNPALQKDASFVIQAEVRASNGGLRRKLLAKWKFGDDLDLIFEKASQVWINLEFEEDYSTIEVEI